MADITRQQLEEMLDESDAELKGEVSDKKSSGGNNCIEQRHQIRVAKYLDLLGVQWNHTPNELYGDTQREGAIKKACGTKAGVPDVLIFDSPPATDEHHCGTAIELKRPDGYPSDVTESQREWLDSLGENGWITKVCFGADEAIEFIEELGYN